LLADTSRRILGRWSTGRDWRMRGAFGAFFACRFPIADAALSSISVRRRFL
jgi:hypothetical protein